MIRELTVTEATQKPKYGLTMLILKSDIKFNESHIYKILQLQQSNVLHQHLYQRLTSSIDNVAALLYKEHKLSNLSLYPLTEIVAVSYFVADKFSCLFYEYTHWDIVKSESVLVTNKEDTQKATVNKVDRYNQMWIVTYLLKEAYTEHVKRIGKQ